MSDLALNAAPKLVSLSKEDRAREKWLASNATVQEVYEISADVSRTVAFKAVGPVAAMLREFADKVAFLEDKLNIQQPEFDAWLAAKRADDAAKQAAAEATPLPEPSAGGDHE